ncbi:MAG: beta-phosphoglucomutase family hydrolase [Trueperaceae bacterium]
MRAGLIFDLDGVLTDTEEYHFRSWRKLAEELGVPFTRATSQALRGRSRPDALELFLAGRRPGTGREELLERKNRYFLEQIESLGPEDLAPGIARLFDQAECREIPLGLASSSRNARLVCRRLGILERFTAFVDGCSTLRPKPAPDMFLWAAGRLGLDPGCCTVVEDSEAGVQAALTGGFLVVGVGPGERVGAAHTVFADLAEATVDDLCRPVARGASR